MEITIDTLSNLHLFLTYSPDGTTCDIANGDLFAGNFDVAHFVNNGVTITVKYTGDLEESFARREDVSPGRV